MWELDHKEGWKWKSLSHVWLYATLCIVHGILQVRILEWVDVSFSRGIFPTQGLNPGLQHCKQILYQLSHQGSPKEEGWVTKNWCFQTVVLEKTLESPLDSKEIKPVNTRGNQPWKFTGKADAKTPILWLLDAKTQLVKKDPHAGKD